MYVYSHFVLFAFICIILLALKCCILPRLVRVSRGYTARFHTSIVFCFVFIAFILHTYKVLLTELIRTCARARAAAVAAAARETTEAEAKTGRTIFEFPPPYYAP